MADGEQAVRWIQERFPDAVVRADAFRGQHAVELEIERLVEVCRALRDDPAMRFDFLADVTAVHWPDDPRPMELVYHLYSYPRNDRLRIKARTGERGPAPTLSGLWQSAAWNEREAYDMFGIHFEGHPDLRRILMPDEYTDFPLRKEFPLYRG
jgi:NADH-quinone oxidoreductase subunit C